MKSKNLLKLRVGKHKIRESVLKQTRKEKNIIFGGKAIQKRLRLSARPTKDYDIFSDKPKKSAFTTEKNLDKSLHTKGFFVKRGANKGTWKVRNVGRDNRKGTKDDVGIVDYTRTPKPRPKTFLDKNVQFRTLKEEFAAKKRLVKKKEFGFRRKKDLEDINRIKKFIGKRK